MPIPNHVREYAASTPQVPIAGGWLVRYREDLRDIDRMVYCKTEHDLAMLLSPPYRAASTGGTDG